MSRLRPSLSVPSHQCFGRIVSWPTICGSSRLPGASKVNLISRSPTFLRLHDVAVIGRVLRMMLLERIQREDHVFRRHRLSVVPFRLRPQPVDDAREIVGMADRFGQRAVFGRDLVQRRRRERFVDQLNAGCERAFDAGNHKVEIIKRPDLDLTYGAALGRLRIDVVEALEAGRVLDLAEQRQRVPPRRFGRRLRLGRRNRGVRGPVRAQGPSRPQRRPGGDVVG